LTQEAAVDLSVFRRHIDTPANTLEVVIRGHLWIESLLNRLIEIEAADPAALDLERMGFRQKVDIAHAFGLLHPTDAVALRGLNRLRNTLAHTLAADPTDADLDRLEGLLDGPVRRMFDAVIAPNVHEPGKDTTARLFRLRQWFLCYVMHLAHSANLRQYEKENQTKLLQAAAIEVAYELTGRPPPVQDEIRQEVGLPDPPDPRNVWET
jgi:hypothetical protein